MYPTYRPLGYLGAAFGDPSVGERWTGGGGFQFMLLPDRRIQVVAAPPGKPAGQYHAAGSPSYAAIVSEYNRLKSAGGLQAQGGAVWTQADAIVNHAIDMALSQTSYLSPSQASLRILRTTYKTPGSTPDSALLGVETALRKTGYPAAAGYVMAARLSGRTPSAAPSAPAPSYAPAPYVAPLTQPYNPNVPGTWPSGAEVQTTANTAAAPGAADSGSITDKPWFGPALAAGVIAVLGGVALFALPSSKRKTNPRRRNPSKKRRRNGAACGCKGRKANPRRKGQKRGRACGCKK